MNQVYCSKRPGYMDAKTSISLFEVVPYLRLHQDMDHPLKLTIFP